MKTLGAVLALLVVALPASAAQLPILASQDLWPIYSPDGRHVAYTVVVNGQGRLFALDVVDTRTKRVARVTLSSGRPSPTWASDGRIAYAANGVLHKANAAGAGRYRYPAAAPALAPAWRPRSEQLAYLTSHGAQNLDLWVGTTLWAKGAIGQPAWSRDGTQLAFQRSGSIWVASQPLVETRLAVTGTEPGPPVWSPDGTRVAYAAAGRVYVVPADASAAATQVGGPFREVGPLAWSPAGDSLAYTVATGVELTTLARAPQSRRLAVGAASGTSFAPSDPQGRILAYAGPVPGCLGHVGILLLDQGLLAGTCTIAGTAGADVIEGTPSSGDVVRAGAGDDRIHVGDRHLDRVDCGPGRDAIWADRSDRLTHCEVVHR
ncbi:MAG: TolB family protein [Gaiellaceae bacterium]